MTKKKKGRDYKFDIIDSFKRKQRYIPTEYHMELLYAFYEDRLTPIGVARKMGVDRMTATNRLLNCAKAQYNGK